MRCSDKQAHVKLGFKQFDLLRQCGLRDIESARACREIEVLGNCEEIAKRSKIH